MVYAGPEVWDVIYRATADFSSLLRGAAEAKAALDSMAKSAREEGDAEAGAALRAAEARRRDAAAIDSERRAMEQLQRSAALSNVQSLFGGRSSMDQHLADIQREAEYQNLLNRAQWLGFTSPQQAYSFRQQEYQQRLLLNRADQAGYATPDQYVGFLQRQRSAMNDLNAMMLRRAQLYRENTDAATAYADTLRGTRFSASQLGEGIDAASALNDALTSLPDQVSVKADFNDSAATTELAAFAAKLVALSRMREEVTLGVNDTAALAKIAEFSASLKRVGPVEPVKVAGAGGAAGGGGGGPPPAAAAAGGQDPNPSDAAAWAALAAEEKAAGDNGVLAAPKLLAAGRAADDSGTQASRAYGWWGLLNRQLTLFGGAFGSAAIFGAVAAWHLALDVIIELVAVVVPALVTAIAGLGAFALGASAAATDLFNHLKAVQTVSSALGQDIPPLTGKFDALQKKMAPAVIELYGGALNSLGRQTGLVGQLATRTAGVLETMTARIDLWLNQSGGGLQKFLQVGGKDLSEFGSIASSVGGIFLKFLQATTQTQVAEKLLGLLALAFRGLADVIKVIPAPLLALGIGLHSVSIYGGLFVSWLKAGALAVDALASKIPGLSGPALSLAQHLGASGDQLAKLAKGTPYLNDLAGGIARGESSAYQLATGLGLSEKSLRDLVAKDPQIQAVAKSLGTTAENVAGVSLGFARSGSSIEEFAGKSKNAQGDLEALTGGFSDAEKNAANLAVYMAGSPGSAATAVGRLEGAFKEAEGESGKFGGALSKLGGWISGNWVLVGAAVIAGLAYVVWWSQQADKATQSFVTRLQTSIGNLNASQAFRAIPDQIQAISTRVTELSTNAQGTFAQMGSGWKQSYQGALGLFTALAAGNPFKIITAEAKGWGDFFTGILHGLGVPIQKNAQDVHALTKEQQTLADQWGNLAKEATTLSRQGFTVDQAFGLMNLAGVKAGDSFDVMRQKVQNLYVGWKNLGVQAGELANSVNAVTLQSELQQSEISKLTGAWDAFFKLVEGGPADFVSYSQALAQVGQDAKKHGASLTGLGAASLTLRSDFLQAASGAQQLLDQLMTQNAAAGNTQRGFDQVTQAGKDLVTQLLPAAKGSQQMTNVLYALAQQAGYTGKDSFAGLSKWVDTASGKMRTAHDPAKQLDSIVTTLGTNSSNLATDVKNLSSAIDTDLNQAIANAVLHFSGAQKPLDSFVQGIEQNKTKILEGVLPAEVTKEGTAWASYLINNVYGRSTQGLAKAKAQWEADLMAAVPGLSKSTADDFWNQLAGAAKKKPAIGLKSPTINTSGVEAKLRALTKESETPPSPKNWQGFWGAIGGFFNNDVFMPVNHFFTSLIPGWAKNMGGWFATGYNVANAGFKRDLSAPVDNWFSKTIPSDAAAMGRTFAGAWNAIAGNFKVSVGGTFAVFFTKTIPGWFGDVSRWWDSTWSGNMKSFNSEIGGPFSTFFTKTIPGWYGKVSTWWSGLWSGNMKSFHSEIAVPFSTFFTGTIPGWWDTLSRKWTGFWKGAWKDFTSDVLNPMEHWFSKSLPNAIETGFRDGINWVISNVINKVINFINNDILSHLPGSLHIQDVQKVASGGAVRMAAGSVPGTGDEDGTHIVAMGGEYMLRKPARMALEASYGRGFMDHLNQADTWLGSGSRGNAASQQQRPGHYAGGGGILGGIEGFLTGAGNVLTSGARDLARFVSGGASELKSLAGKGAEAVFNAIWNTTINPMTDVVPATTMPGAVLHGGTNAVKSGIDKFLTGQDSKAKAQAASTGGISMAGVSNASAVAALRSAAAKKGWGSGAEWNALNYVEMREAGYNIHAQNPMSGAYGMAQFINGPGEYYQYGGNPNTAAGQSVAMVNYIAQRYHDPIAAAAHERAVSWYAGGGPVPVAGGDGASLMASGGLTGWGPLNTAVRAEESAFWALMGKKLPASASASQRAAWAAWQKELEKQQVKTVGLNRTPPGAFQVLASDAASPSKMTAGQWWNLATDLSYLQKEAEGIGIPGGINPPGTPKDSGWVPWHYFRPQWQSLTDRLRIANTAEAAARSQWAGLYSVTPVGPAGSAASTGTEAPEWDTASAALNDAVRAEMSAFWGLVKAGLYGSATPAQRTAWTAWKRELEKQQLKTVGLGRTPPGAYQAISDRLTTPGLITAGQWSNLTRNLAYEIREEEGTGIPGGINPPGTPRNSGWVPWHYFPQRWKALLTSSRTAQAKALAAQTVWSTLYGPGHLPYTPGAAGAGSPPAAVLAPGSANVAPEATIGGPAVPVLGGLDLQGTPDLGFASGGGLDQVAAMFALGGVVGLRQPQPSFTGSGLVQGLMQSHPRTVSEAAAAVGGDRIGVKIGDITVNNPRPERASDTIVRTGAKLSLLAGRGA